MSLTATTIATTKRPSNANTSCAVCAVIVTYQCQKDALIELLDIIHQQLTTIFIIDNDPQRDRALFEHIDERFSNCVCMFNAHNLGPAAAYNKGIAQALIQDFDYILLLDQDSLPAESMLERLIKSMQSLTREHDVAAVGASLCDQRNQHILPLTRYAWHGEIKIFPDPKQAQTLKIDCIISSGSLLNASAVRTVGLLDEQLFIDDVDFEWCFRAQAKGYAIYAISNAVLHHRVGEYLYKIPLLNRELFIHKPFRQYFIIRNHILLIRRAYIPWGWKITSCKDILLRTLFFSLFIKPRWVNCKMMLCGIVDGLLKRNRTVLMRD